MLSLCKNLKSDIMFQQIITEQGWMIIEQCMPIASLPVISQ